MFLRRTVSRVHKWSGLFLGVFVLVQALTGLGLTFRDGLQQYLSAEIIPEVSYKGVPNIDAALSSVAKAFPNGSVERFTFPQQDGGAVVLRLTDRITGEIYEVACDPASGEVFGRLDGWSQLPLKMFFFHKELLLGFTGHLVIFIEGVLLIGFLISGLYLWWPARRQKLAVRWKANSFIRRLDLHRLVGVLLIPVIGLVAITGTVMAGRIMLLSKPATTAVASPSALTPTTINQSIEDILAADTSVRIKDIRFGVDGKNATVLIFAPDGPWHGAVDRLTLSRSDGAILGVRRAAEENNWRIAYNWMYPLHSGKAFGAYKEPVLVIAGLGVCLLYLFGFLMWRSRNQRRRASH